MKLMSITVYLKSIYLMLSVLEIDNEGITIFYEWNKFYSFVFSYWMRIEQACVRTREFKNFICIYGSSVQSLQPNDLLSNETEACIREIIRMEPVNPSGVFIEKYAIPCSGVSICSTKYLVYHRNHDGSMLFSHFLDHSVLEWDHYLNISQ